IGEASFSEAFRLMRLQKSVDGRDYLNLAPALVVAGPNQETALKKFLASINPAETQNVNIFSGSVSPVIDAEIDDDSYYFFSNPMIAAAVKIVRLQGLESVRTESKVNWRNDAIEMKLTYAAAAKAIDFRPVVKNEGDDE